MKVHIHAHDNPKITTGPMAAHREPKPIRALNADGEDDFAFNERELKQWQSSLLAYMKEPGFKDKDLIYHINDGKKFKIKDVENKQYWLVIGKNGGLYKKDYVKENYSHYHEGQEIDLEKFRYVREVEKDVDWINKQSPRYKKTYTEWQEVKEPRAFISSTGEIPTSDTVYLPNPKWEQFQKGKREGTFVYIILLEKTKI